MGLFDDTGGGTAPMFLNWTPYLFKPSVDRYTQLRLQVGDQMREARQKMAEKYSKDLKLDAKGLPNDAANLFDPAVTAQKALVAEIARQDNPAWWLQNSPEARVYKEVITRATMPSNVLKIARDEADFNTMSKTVTEKNYQDVPLFQEGLPLADPLRPDRQLTAGQYINDRPVSDEYSPWADGSKYGSVIPPTGSLRSFRDLQKGLHELAGNAGSTGTEEGGNYDVNGNLMLSGNPVAQGMRILQRADHLTESNVDQLTRILNMEMTSMSDADQQAYFHGFMGTNEYKRGLTRPGSEKRAGEGDFLDDKGNYDPAKALEGMYEPRYKIAYMDENGKEASQDVNFIQKAQLEVILAHAKEKFKGVHLASINSDETGGGGNNSPESKYLHPWFYHASGFPGNRKIAKERGDVRDAKIDLVFKAKDGNYVRRKLEVDEFDMSPEQQKQLRSEILQLPSPDNGLYQAAVKNMDDMDYIEEAFKPASVTLPGIDIIMDGGAIFPEEFKSQLYPVEVSPAMIGMDRAFRRSYELKPEEVEKNKQISLTYDESGYPKAKGVNLDGVASNQTFIKVTFRLNSDVEDQVRDFAPNGTKVVTSPLVSKKGKVTPVTPEESGTESPMELLPLGYIVSSDPEGGYKQKSGSFNMFSEDNLEFVGYVPVQASWATIGGSPANSVHLDQQRLMSKDGTSGAEKSLMDNQTYMEGK